MTSISKKLAIYIISIISIFLILYLLCYIINNTLIFPTPLSILIKLKDLLLTSNTYITIGYTLLRLIIAILISFIIGATLGILAGKIEFIRLFLKPWITIFRSIPLASIIIIIMVISGLSKSPYIISMLVLIPIIYESFLSGVLNIDKELMEVWKLESNFNTKVLTKIIFPLASPFIKTSFIQSVGLGIKVLIMAEFVCGTKNSIGKALTNSANYFEYDSVYAWSIIAIILVIIVENIPKLISFIYNYIKDKRELKNLIK